MGGGFSAARLACRPGSPQYLAQMREYQLAAACSGFGGGVGGAPRVPRLVREAAHVDALGSEVEEQGGLAFAGMVERVLADDLARHQRVPLDPVERIAAARLVGIVVRHLRLAPPAFAALPLEELEDRLPGRQA